jgi:hypothetical protein
MSRAITIYAINYRKMLLKLPQLLRNGYEFDFGYEFKFDHQTVAKKIEDAPESLTDSEIETLIRWCEHYYSKYLKQDWISKVKPSLSKNGISDICNISVTSYSVVFMELFDEYYPEIKEKGLENNFYRLARQQLLDFVETILIYQKIFWEYENPQECMNIDHLDKNRRELIIPVAKKKLEEEIQLRNEIGENYSGKWSANFFHFFNFGWFDFLMEAVAIENDDVYFIQDSF